MQTACDLKHKVALSAALCFKILVAVRVPGRRLV
jgi:hypothetical protein